MYFFFPISQLTSGSKGSLLKIRASKMSVGVNDSRKKQQCFKSFIFPTFNHLLRRELSGIKVILG